jgi:peptidoglycan hydrolase-like protein with peptidoglycan-binding domain
MVAVADVQPGKSDPSVQLLQQALNQVGATIVIDGEFGPATQTAYKNWQQSLGFTGADADGVPGASSLATLGDRTGLFLLAPAP